MSTRCSKCILPSDFPSVHLSKDGECNYCSLFEEKKINAPRESNKDRELKFEKILDRFKGKGQYDCLVPVSGGKDSMYVLYVLAKKYNLNILAYNFNNGFQSPLAVQNIKRAVKKLGVDLIIYKPNENMMFKFYKIFLSQAGEICGPCNTFIASMAKKIAKQNGIRLIMTGNSAKYSSAIDGVSASTYCDRKYFFSVLKEYKDIQDYMRNIFYSPIVHGFWKLTGTGPEKVDVLNYLHPGVANLQKIIEKEIEWVPPSDEYEHGDCLLNLLKDYLMCRKWGYSELTQAYSALIRNGEINREEALQKAEMEEVREPPAILESFLETIGLSNDEFEASKKRHFTDFANYSSSPLYILGKKCLNLVHQSK
ncbi:N-acetyl sugar amidotransferase [Desulfobacula toluolica]|uniref:Conserved uncharacterized protein n=1 Tax=Desulfobacula toluolica (strain DSM 7467 / Tol2) TaxID=651182 RepID=K0NJZ5_DESTT|nr:N-acetyl sugar amidotransferase [Desulfobacula toluolica]CCK81826.1 conserved uncharacterized protein [Desulfobacula toluolica Tol2]